MLHSAEKMKLFGHSNAWGTIWNICKNGLRLPIFVDFRTLLWGDSIWGSFLSQLASKLPIPPKSQFSSLPRIQNQSAAGSLDMCVSISAGALSCQCTARQELYRHISNLHATHKGNLVEHKTLIERVLCFGLSAGNELEQKTSTMWRPHARETTVQSEMTWDLVVQGKNFPGFFSALKDNPVGFQMVC